MYDIILDTLKDGIRLLPFLFVTYIVMEYIEHKMLSLIHIYVYKRQATGGQ